MNNDNRLSQLMISHHGLIEVLLSVFKDNLVDPAKAKEAYEDFRWQAEKHIFVEEKINFRYLFETDEGLIRTVEELKAEHIKLLDMIARIGQILEEGKNVELEPFATLFMEHREKEENTLYPKMDELMNPYQKDTVIARINEVVMKK